jgi:1-phosphofructokinase family hexose kinase
MIYTITINTSLDRTIEVEEFLYDDVNTVLEEKRCAGGKGIDVSRAIKCLGGESVAVGIAGGYNGLEIEGRLIGEGIISDFMKIDGESGSNITIHQRKKKQQTSLSTSPAVLSQFDITAFHDKIRNIPRESLVVISGGLCPGFDSNFYAQVIMSLKEKGARVFLDTDDEMLRKGVEAGPYMMKPNIHEFGRLVEKPIKDYEDVLDNVAPYVALCEYIVVSMGVRGAVGIARNERYLAVPPRVPSNRLAGAGDALLGGFVFGVSKGLSFSETLSLAVSCGAASAASLGFERFSLEDVENIKQRVVTKKL